MKETKERFAPMVIVNWSPRGVGLVRALAAVVPSPPPGEVAVICVGTQPADRVDAALRDSSVHSLMRYVPAPTLSEGIERLARVLADDVDIARAQAVIVLPDDATEEPDAASRLTCAAVGRACEPDPVPNILVEVEDPEAAYEFAGLGVATVFYPGYLRAALLAHACVDLGVFQFVYGLLRGRYRVRLHPIDPQQREGTFFDLACALEEDEQGRPITPIGLQLPAPADAGERAAAGDGLASPDAALVINPGPRHPIGDALGVLVLVSA